MAAHLAGRPTGAPGKCQAARRPSPPLGLRLQLINAAWSAWLICERDWWLGDSGMLHLIGLQHEQYLVPGGSNRLQSWYLSTWWGLPARLTGNVLKHPYHVLFGPASTHPMTPRCLKLLPIRTIICSIIFGTILIMFCLNFFQAKPTTCTIFDLATTFLLSDC